MPEFLSPGVFIEEIPSQVNVVAGVSTSTLGVLGYSPEGPTDTATLVGSMQQFSQTFGGFTRESYLAHTVAAFFANGGRRCYVVRVAPADATNASAQIESSAVGQSIGTQPTTQVATFPGTFASTANVAGVSTDTPLISTGTTLKWRTVTAANAVVSGAITDSDTGAAMAGDATDLFFRGVVTGALPAYDYDLPAIAPPSAGPATVLTLNYNTGPVVNLALTVNGFIASGSDSDVESCVLDLRSGKIAIRFASGQAPSANPITLSYTPLNATVSVTDVAGTFTHASLTSGSVNLTTGAVALVWTAATGAPAPFTNVVVSNATRRIWQLNAKNAGVWANDLRFDVSGNADSFSASTASYSLYDIQVLRDDGTGNFIIQEIYEGVSFTDPTSEQYFPDVINELSDLVEVVTPGSDDALVELSGRQRVAVVLTQGSGKTAGTDTPTATAVATLPVGTPIAPRTVTLTATSAASATLTVTDDGNGNLIGNVNGSGTNTIDYTTGAVNVTFSANLHAGTFVTAAFYTQSSVDPDSSLFASGTDGTFDSTNWGRNQFTAPALETNSEGLYALNRVDELMQVAVPDFAGDVTVTGDLLDYADVRANRPSGGDRFIILTTPSNQSAQEAVDWFRFDLNRSSKFAALYWPWIKVADPLANGRPLSVPPLGHIAGVYARVDNTRNVGKTPAGVTDGRLAYLLRLESENTQSERDLVYTNKINPLTTIPGTGPVVWGGKMIATESDWRYLNARRLFMFVEKSIYNATQWIVFENNGPGLWARIETQLNGFLSNLFDQGYFAGATGSQAFYVICDASNNTPASVNSGQVIAEVGIAPNIPAEFVRLQFTQIIQT